MRLAECEHVDEHLSMSSPYITFSAIFFPIIYFYEKYHIGAWCRDRRGRGAKRKRKSLSPSHINILHFPHENRFHNRYQFSVRLHATSRIALYTIFRTLIRWQPHNNVGDDKRWYRMHTPFLWQLLWLDFRFSEN